MCVLRKLTLACLSTQSDQGLSLPPEETLDPWLPIERPTMTLIRLRAESSMGPHAKLYQLI